MITFKGCLVLCFISLFFSSEVIASEKKADESSIPYKSPNKQGNSIHLAEHFDNKVEFEKKWIVSKAKKPDVSEDLAQYDGKWELLPLERFPLKGDRGLVLTTESRHAAIASKFEKPFVFDGRKKFIVQYVVAFQKPVDCGGAYLKLLTEDGLPDLTQFNDRTPYTIMFGPDKCGGMAKMHFIIRHKHPVTGEITEKHCTKLKVDDAMYKDNEPYLLKLVIEPDNGFAFYINNELQYKGNLLDDDAFEPPINPPKQIVDPSDKKPEDWDDRPKIPDATATKPDDWDESEPAEVPDSTAVKPDGWLDDEPLTIEDEDAPKPDDWDEDIDGDWEPPKIDNPACKEAPGCGEWIPPTIANPKYKGKWQPPMIDNPNFKGKWTPKKIPNPEYYYDTAPLKSSPIGYLGFELWTLVNNMYFDDILVTDSEAVSNEWVENTWALKKKNLAQESVTIKGRILKQINFKPGWWILYTLYCIVPITLFILYMRSVIRKASFYKMFLDYTNNYPWLWAVYVLVLAIIVGVIGTCWLRFRGHGSDYEKILDSKKTDESLPDDEPVEKRYGSYDYDPGLEDLKNAEPIIPGVKSYDEEDETDPEEKTSKPSSDEEDTKEEAEEKEQEVDDENKENETVEETVPPSPRKRRPRKD